LLIGSITFDFILQYNLKISNTQFMISNNLSRASNILFTGSKRCYLLDKSRPIVKYTFWVTQDKRYHLSNMAQP